MIWKPEFVAELTKLWQEKLSAALIGQRLGLTKNAVLGKAHRLGLEKRDNKTLKKRGIPKKTLEQMRADLRKDIAEIMKAP